MNRMRVKTFVPYVLAIGLVPIATCITLCVPTLRTIHSLAPYLVSVVVVAWFGGLGPSMLTILLSTLSFAYFIAPPSGFAIGEWQDKVRLCTFIIIAFMFSL